MEIQKIKKSIILTSPFDLSSCDIKEFQSLYFKKYGVPINEQKAKLLATQLLLTIKAIFKPIPKNYA